MDETVFRNQEDDVVFLADLHGYWEVVYGIGGEENVNSALLEGRVGVFVVDFDDVKLLEAFIRFIFGGK